MGRKPQGDRPLSPAQRQARMRVKKRAQSEVWRKALEEITTVRLASEAREIAIEALASG